jgi:hypothetical protein
MEIDIKDALRNKYATIAVKRSNKSSDDEAALAHAFGYSDGELASIPGEANLGVSCGNPTAMASLLPGEVAGDSDFDVNEYAAVVRSGRASSGLSGIC